MRSRSLVVVAPGFVTTLLVAHVAAAQPAGDGVRPALDARGYLTVDGSQTLDRGDVSFGLGELDWSHNLNTPGAMPLSNAMTATLAAAIGLPLGPIPLELAATQPFSIASGIGQGTGDLGLHAKAQLIDGRKHVIGFGVIARAYLPTASGPTAMMTASGFVPEVDGVVDVQLGRVRLAATAGERWQSGARSMPIGGAAAFAVTPERFEVIGEVTGTVGLDNQAATLEGLGGVKLYLARSSYLTLAAGRGLDTEGGTDTRALISIVFEPKPGQLAHVSYEAPPEPAEPEPAPPKPAEQPDPPDCTATPRPDGCLDLASVVESHIVILKPINFEFDKAVITADSFPVLDAVADTLDKNPDIKLVEIGGHTDERGDAAYNLSLSDRRAAAVVTYLVGKGIDAGRLRSRGYGKTVPVDPAHDEAAWTKNRRVEFTIQERD
jgi:outer membrane protein OmpA-like peptidoglycan-associated protein